MKKLDLLYEAFLKYRSLTKNFPLVVSSRNIIKNNNVGDDKFVVKKFQVVINDEWINEIEENLIYIEKALDQERQFIRTNSEVVEIEKVKRISKESVVDLAKHSEYITKEHDNGDIIPDKILMVEKLSDFAVYENRFLYMLIRYIRDFIDLRLDKIQRTHKLYESNFVINKEVKEDSREFNFNITFNDHRTNNNHPLIDDETKELIKRLENINEILESFLKRQIMVDVSKHPMVKSPITKTNVLKNDNNFKHALALYEYLASYFTDGFEIKEVVYDFAPFGDMMADYFSELYVLCNYMCYTFGNDLQDTLKNRYELKQAREKEERELAILKQIERLKKEIELEGSDVYSYMLLLEKRMKLLDDKLIDYNKALEDKQALFEKNEQLRTSIFSLEAEISKLNNDALDALKQYNDSILSLENEYKDKLLEKEQEFSNNICNLNLDIDDYKTQIEELKRERATYQEEIDSKFNEDKLKLEREYVELRNDLEKRENEIIEELAKNKEVLVEKGALYYGLMAKENKLDLSFTNKESFEELEEIFIAFSKFFKANFEKTKKEIKKQLYWYDKQQDL